AAGAVPDGRYWYVAGRGVGSAAGALAGGPAAATPAVGVQVATELPHPTAAGVFTAIEQNTADYLIAPGRQVAVKIEITGSPPEKIAGEVREAARKVIEAHRLVVTDGPADLTLTVSAGPGGGPKTTVRTLGPGETGPGTAQTIPIPYLRFQAGLSVGGEPAV